MKNSSSSRNLTSIFWPKKWLSSTPHHRRSLGVISRVLAQTNRPSMPRPTTGNISAIFFPVFLISNSFNLSGHKEMDNKAPQTPSSCLGQCCPLPAKEWAFLHSQAAATGSQQAAPLIHCRPAFSPPRWLKTVKNTAQILFVFPGWTYFALVAKSREQFMLSGYSIFDRKKYALKFEPFSQICRF